MSELRGDEGERGDSLPATFSASSSANRTRRVSTQSRCAPRSHNDENAPMDESDLAIASLIIDMVFSKLLLLVEGLVLVVPNELCLPCPFLNLADAFSEVGLMGATSPLPDPGDPGTPPNVPSFISVDPLGLGLLPSGEEGAVEASNESPSSHESPAEETKSSGSMRSGGKCSLSMSDLRASVKLVMDSLMPSAPLARAP